MDPTWIMAASNVLGRAMQPAAPAGPSNALSGSSDYNVFDTSGWIIGTGGSTVEGRTASGAGSAALEIPWGWLIIASLAGLVVWKKA